MTRRDFLGALSEVENFERGRTAAAKRLRDARNVCDAVAGQPMVIQAQATIDLEDAIAVGSEWGLIQMSPGA